MDYFTDVFVAFLDLDHVRILALVRELSDSEDERRSCGLEQHEGK